VPVRLQAEDVVAEIAAGGVGGQRPMLHFGEGDDSFGLFGLGEVRGVGAELEKVGRQLAIDIYADFAVHTLCATYSWQHFEDCIFLVVHAV